MIPALLHDRRAWLFSTRAFLAAIAALYIGLAAGLPRPYWAMATVYIVIQPMLGPTRAKGFYRIVGTLVAGAAVLAIMPGLLATPLLLCLAMALWLSGCLFIALLNRGPRGYAFLLASYTTAFIGFPAVTAPEGLFDTVVARSEEIILGTTMAVMATALLFPPSLRPMLAARIGGWMGDAAQWSRLVLERARHTHGPRNRLAADLVQFRQLIESVRHDDPRTADAAEPLEKLRERLLLLLPLLSSIADRLAALEAGGQPLPADLQPLVADIADWLEQPVREDDARTHAALAARIAALKPQLDDDLQRLLLDGLLLRLQELLDLWQDCRTLQRAVEHGAPTARAPLYRIRLLQRPQGRHVDLGMVGFSALSAGVALFAYCLLWIQLGWSAGGNGAMMTAVAAAFFASQDDPVPHMLSFLLWAVVSCVVAGIYLFGILPAVHDFGLLVLVLAPPFLFLGLLLHNPRTMLIGLPMLANLSTLLGLQASYSADLQGFVNAALAMVAGIGFAAVITRLFRSVGAEWSARRLLRQNWTTLAQAADGHGLQDRRGFAARMLDLLGLLAPRLAAMPAGSDLASVDMLTEARIGLNILQLRRARHDLPASSEQAVDAILADVAAHYRAQAGARRPLAPADALRDRLDTSLSRVRLVTAGKARDEALLGLLGLRYCLFPGQTPEVAVTPALAPQPV